MSNTYSLDAAPTTTWQRSFNTNTNAARNSTSSDRSTSSYRDRLSTGAEKLQRSTMTTYRRASDTYRSMSLLQRVLCILAACFAVASLVLFLRFGESVFAWIAPLAEKWRGVRGGWAVLWLVTFFVGVPPLIGYSSCVTVAGFVYGVWKGWLIVSTATILGSTFSFLLSRHLLTTFVHRLVSHDRRFTALALTLKHDGIKLLLMIRLCPLPYSLSNGALATFPTVNWQSFMFATALATPKLLIHVFIGSRLAKIAGGVGEDDFGAKMVNWLGVVVSMTVGAFTAWFIYRQTKRRAEELEAQERGANGGHGRHHDDNDDDEEDGETDYDEDFEERGDARTVANGNGHGHGEVKKSAGVGLEGYRDDSSGDERR